MCVDRAAAWLTARESARPARERDDEVVAAARQQHVAAQPVGDADRGALDAREESDARLLALTERARGERAASDDDDACV